MEIMRRQGGLATRSQVLAEGIPSSTLQSQSPRLAGSFGHGPHRQRRVLIALTISYLGE